MVAWSVQARARPVIFLLLFFFFFKSSAAQLDVFTSLPSLTNNAGSIVSRHTEANTSSFAWGSRVTRVHRQCLEQWRRCAVVHVHVNAAVPLAGGVHGNRGNNSVWCRTIQHCQSKLAHWQQHLYPMKTMLPYVVPRAPTTCCTWLVFNACHWNALKSSNDKRFFWWIHSNEDFRINVLFLSWLVLVCLVLLVVMPLFQRSAREIMFDWSIEAS